MESLYQVRIAQTPSVNYSEPHAQNRCFCLCGLLRHITQVKYACEQIYSASICMALNSFKYGTRLYPSKALVNTFNSKRYSETNFMHFRLIILIFSKFHLILLSAHIVILQI